MAEQKSSPALTKQRRMLDALIPLIRKHDGLPFGGVARDIHRNRDFKDVDVWFQREIDTNAYIAAVNEGKDFAFAGEVKSFVPVTGMEYTFKHMQVSITEVTSQQTLLLDFVVAPTLPCNDFDVNEMTYDGKEVSAPTADILKHAGSGLAIMKPDFPAQVAKLNPTWTPTRVNQFVVDRVAKLLKLEFIVWGTSEDIQRQAQAQVPKALCKPWFYPPPRERRPIAAPVV